MKFSFNREDSIKEQLAYFLDNVVYNYENMKKLIENDAKYYLACKFINRIENYISFEDLDENDIDSIEYAINEYERMIKGEYTSEELEKIKLSSDNKIESKNNQESFLFSDKICVEESLLEDEYVISSEDIKIF